MADVRASGPIVLELPVAQPSDALADLRPRLGPHNLVVIEKGEHSEGSRWRADRVRNLAKLAAAEE